MAYGLDVQVLFLDPASADPDYNFFTDPAHAAEFQPSDGGYRHNLLGVAGVRSGQSGVYDVSTYAMRFPSEAALIAFLERFVIGERTVVLGGGQNTMFDTSPSSITVLPGAASGLLVEVRTSGAPAFVMLDGKLDDHPGFLAAVPGMLASRFDSEMEEDEGISTRSDPIVVPPDRLAATAHLRGQVPALDVEVLVGASDMTQQELLTDVLAALGIETAIVETYEGGDVSIEFSENETDYSVYTSSVPLPQGAREGLNALVAFQASTELPVERRFDDTVADWAYYFGYCATVDIPFDALVGTVTGFRRQVDGTLEKNRRKITEADYEDSIE
ncbi:MAG: hypothetical protein AAFV74_22550 [Pseudomonadota bacterium]